MLLLTCQRGPENDMNSDLAVELLTTNLWEPQDNKVFYSSA